MSDKTLIVGLGEVGIALMEILARVHDVYVKDDDTQDFARRDWYRGPENGAHFDVMHVCFPFQNEEQFRIAVEKLEATYAVEHTVVHSTVPIGTCRALGVLHSPVMGRHPYMIDDLLTFTKFVGGPFGSLVADHFRAAGMRVYLTDRQETTEACKLLSTLFYSVCIEFTKDVKQLCLDNSLPFEMWTLWTDAYNEGVVAGGRSELVRPNLVPQMHALGGHCLSPNLELIESAWAEFVKERQR